MESEQTRSRHRRRRPKHNNGPKDQNQNRRRHRRGRRPHQQSSGQPGAAVLDQQAIPDDSPGEVVAGQVEVTGVLDVLPTGLGFLRQIENDLLPAPTDYFIPANLINQHKLRTGMTISGMLRANTPQGKAPAVAKVTKVMNKPVEEYQPPVPFDRQISIDPLERFTLTPADTPSQERSMRLLELMIPIGKGQRTLIVAPPRTGKTTLLHDLAASVARHHPDVHILVLLVDERPEEVTHFKRSIKGQVVASSADKGAASHIKVAKLTLEYARTLAEHGEDVFMLLDSITRLGRASNREEKGHGGKTLSGGMGTRALEFPRKFFGSARNLEDGGSLTIVGTALIDTGSRMDEVIFQEFKGTGNMELVLDRKIAESRLFPAVDLSQSGTRKEEKILPPAWLNASYKLRRHLSTLKPQDALEVLLERLAKAQDIDSFCNSIA